MAWNVPTVAAHRQARSLGDERIERLNEVKDTPLVDAYPAFAGIMSDRAGYLWVREYRGTAWTVFNPEGRIQGRSRLRPDSMSSRSARTTCWG